MVGGIGGLDLAAMGGSYRGTGSASYHPTLLLGLLVYGYATGVFSSRKLERATYDSVAFRFIAANDHPDHDTIATFRARRDRRGRPASTCRSTSRSMMRAGSRRRGPGPSPMGAAPTTGRKSYARKTSRSIMNPTPTFRPRRSRISNPS